MALTWLVMQRCLVKRQALFVVLSCQETQQNLNKKQALFALQAGNAGTSQEKPVSYYVTALFMALFRLGTHRCPLVALSRQ